MGMRLDIPDSVLQGLRIPEGEIAERLRTELAIALYAQGALSLGKAAELAELDRMAFGQLVGQRGIARHYGEAELAQDISYARSEEHLADRNLAIVGRLQLLRFQFRCFDFVAAMIRERSGRAPC
jgi:predicted HTH domain antitoxin